MLLLLTLLLLTIATPALAVDGVLEINQTCAVQTGCFQADTAGWPVTVSASGSYRLTSNLTIPDENTDGIVVSSTNTTVDLNGFGLIRVGCEGLAEHTCLKTGTGSGIKASNGAEAYGLSVKNGSVIGMGQTGIVTGEHSSVSNVRVRRNGNSGIHLQHHSLLTESHISRNGSGVFANSNTVISRNLVAENDGAGIHCAGGGASISQNMVHGNGKVGDNASDGIYVSGDGAHVDGNLIRSNGRYGLKLVGSGNVYRDNTIGTAAYSTGSVDGGVNAGGNFCNGVICP
jgi:hypothetical protein